MEYSIVSIYWERVLLHFQIKMNPGVRNARVFLEDEISGSRFELKRTDKDAADEEFSEYVEYYINITNPGIDRCMPDGVYRLRAADSGGSPLTQKQVRADQTFNADRSFPFSRGMDVYSVTFTGSPLTVTVKTVYSKHNRMLRKAVLRKGAAVLYRFEHSVCHIADNRRKKKKVLFLSGQSVRPGGNLTAVRDRMRERGLDSDRGGFEIIESYRDRGSGARGMIKAMRKIAAADYIFLDDHEPIFDNLILDRKTVLTQLWHGGVGFKSSGYSRWGHPGCPPPFGCHRQYTWGVVSSRAVVPIYSEIWGINDDQILPLGMPRMDRFLDPGHRAEAERSLRDKFPLTKGKNVILFAPTYRGSGKAEAFYPYDRIDFDLLYETLGNASVVLFHMHPWVRSRVPIPDKMLDRMADTAADTDINDLFYITDLLITDYSSAICEFSLMDRPMLFYGFDEEEYSRDRGFHRNYEEFAPGKVCHTFDELMEACRSGDFEQEKAARYVREQFDYRDCGSSDRVIDRVLLGKKINQK